MRILVRLAAVAVIVSALAALAPPALRAAVPSPEALILADFDGEAAAFPSGWTARADSAAATRVYQVMGDQGSQYLHAVAQGDSVQIGLPVSLHLESGAEERDTWKTETVNVVEDYRRLFQAEPPEPQGIAILTDADDTKSRAVADYDDFRALAATSPSAMASEIGRQPR